MQTDLTLTKNKKYTLTFDAYADTNRNITIQIAENGTDEDGDGDSYSMLDENFRLDITTANTTYTIDLYMLEDTISTGRLVFLLGLDSNNVYLDNISMTESDITIPSQGTEMIANGDVSSGTDNWKLLSFGSSATLTDNGGELFLNISSTTGTPGDIQIYQREPGLRLVNGNNYRLTFYAWADSDRDLITYIWENAHDLNNDNNYFGIHGSSGVLHNITTVKTQYTVNFTMDTNNYDAGLVFFCGATSDNIYIDDVSLVEVP
jgi:hypothetical protein